MREKMFRIASELGKSEGDFVRECAEAILKMVESEAITVPNLVTMARTLRSQHATMLDPERPFPAPHKYSSLDADVMGDSEAAGHHADRYRELPGADPGV